MSIIALDIRGTVLEPADENPAIDRRYTYQRTAPGLGNLRGTGKFDRQRRRCVIPHDPKTSAQLSRRYLMREAVAAWHAADSTARETARHTARRRRLNLFQAWCSDWINSHTAAPATVWDILPCIWDDAATVWDDSATLWDATPQTDWDLGNTFWDI